ncbi:uncharacterized protein LOC108134603 [Drosophila elegans]|uniref:uncharacterized protein LOC108134603 n=1 Tax=Drosophila elegans TaxID=30023 RepID=UPI0007E852CB|nr:uncharacterized protein LOC108134603 [Drosophila elegans]
MDKPGKKDIDFKVERDTHQTNARTYGFMKTTRSDTPIPLAKKSIVPITLMERLSGLTAIRSQTSENEEGLSEEQSSSSSYSKASNKTTFEMKRKLFDEAEFTITRGQKLSDVFHPGHVEGQMSFTDPGKHSLEEMEAYCERMNIKFAK